MTSDKTRFVCTAVEMTLEGSELYDIALYLLANVMSEMDEGECRQKFAALPAELKRMIDGRWEQMANFGSFEQVESIKL